MAVLAALGLLLVLSGCGQVTPTGAAPTSTRSPDPRGWTFVSCGGATMALQSDGTLWAWGANDAGQLGLGYESLRSVKRFTQVGSDADWAAVACGQYATAAIKTDGTLWTWGGNRNHELGLGDTRMRLVPTQVGSDRDWASVACGNGVVLAPGFALAIKRDGSLWGWGENGDQELGLGVTSEDTVSRPTRVGTDSDWTAVSCGTARAMAIKRDGTLWGWGSGFMGELGLGGNSAIVPTQVGSDHDWAAVSSGDAFTVALKKDGSLWVTGKNDFGTLGIPGAPTQNFFTRLGTDSDWASISAGQSSSTLALKQDGSLWAWGFSEDGELGLGDLRQRSAPTRQRGGMQWVSVATGGASAGIKSDGSLWIWGWHVARPTEVK